jgi:hypothetical protein
MTITLAWIRKVDTVEELVVASDSRLAFGCRWDCCPKILALPRNDAVICFAGDTMYAYPVMLQAIAAVSQHPRLLSRGMDLHDLKGHLLRVLNGMTSLVHDLPAGIDASPDTTFLFGGWSWKEGAFKVWLLHFDQEIKRFTFRPTSHWQGSNGHKLFAFTGDYEVEYKAKLIDLLRKKGKLDGGGFDMEPLEVLRDMLRAGTFDTIGGAPQVMKVYKYSSCMPYAVFWPDRETNEVNLLGRPLLHYEQSEYLVLDLDTMQTTKHSSVEPNQSFKADGFAAA